MSIKLKFFKIVNHYSPEQSRKFDQLIHVKFVKTFCLIPWKTLEFDVFRRNHVIENDSGTFRAFSDDEQRMFTYFFENGTELSDAFKDLIKDHINDLIHNAKCQQRKYENKNEIQKLLRNS